MDLVHFEKFLAEGQVPSTGSSWTLPGENFKNSEAPDGIVGDAPVMTIETTEDLKMNNQKLLG